MKIVVALLVLAGLLLLAIWLIRRAPLRSGADRMFAWTLALFFLSPALAWAADAPAVTSPIQDAMTAIMQLVALVLAGLVAWTVKLLAAKFKLTISTEQEDLVRKVARDGVYFAEEWAAKRFGATEAAGQGAQKLQAATTFILAKIPGLDQVAAQQAIHAALGSIQGLGASKAVGEKN